VSKIRVPSGLHCEGSWETGSEVEICVQIYEGVSLGPKTGEGMNREQDGAEEEAEY
jgi:hypothetical protein